MAQGILQQKIKFLETGNRESIDLALGDSMWRGTLEDERTLTVARRTVNGHISVSHRIATITVRPTVDVNYFGKPRNASRKLQRWTLGARGPSGEVLPAVTDTSTKNILIRQLNDADNDFCYGEVTIPKPKEPEGEIIQVESIALLVLTNHILSRDGSSVLCNAAQKDEIQPKCSGPARLTQIFMWLVPPVSVEVDVVVIVNVLGGGGSVELEVVVVVSVELEVVVVVDVAVELVVLVVELAVGVSEELDIGVGSVLKLGVGGVELRLGVALLELGIVDAPLELGVGVEWTVNVSLVLDAVGVELELEPGTVDVEL
ncbi:hypothetical protein C8R47DRAFT_1081150 [Mycena vitilis]|nr:hypothetical protein C8R47DRAFT_1081150 [Mycena vitilis]